MKVAQMSRLLDSLHHGLADIVGAPVANDLRSIETALEPFHEASIAEFTRFLGEFGQAFKETGKITPQGKIALPKPAKTPKTPKTSSEQLIADAVATIRALLKEIDTGSVDDLRVDQLLNGMSKLTIADLHHVLSELRIAEKPKSKPKVFAKIKEVIHHQMEAHAKAASVGATPFEFEPIAVGS